MYSKEENFKANIALHSALADKYRDCEPHYRPENITWVSNIIKRLKDETHGDSLLDIGCGSGFVIDIAKNYFKKITGIDITPAMLEMVDTKCDWCDIQVLNCSSEAMLFAENSFDVCSAYALLHHLYDITPTLREVFRVLKKGGVFYSDLDPNFYFWQALSQLPAQSNYSDIVKREIKAVINKGEELEENFNIDKNTIYAAEQLKHIYGGFKEEALNDILKQVGFSKWQINYFWFLGEASIIHGKDSGPQIGIFRDYMQSLLPLSRHLFKYVSIMAVK